MDLEGVKLRSYPDSNGVWTIGVGVTRWPNGERVKPGQTITRAEAMALFRQTLPHFERGVDDLTRDDITQQQFDALTCLAYNIGIEALRTSTVRRLVNRNPNDPMITEGFKMWRRAAGKPRLLGRRITEANWYFGQKV